MRTMVGRWQMEGRSYLSVGRPVHECDDDWEGDACGHDRVRVVSLDSRGNR